MNQLRTAAELRAWADAEIAAGQRIVLVPTMGYLHEGHASLMRLAHQHGTRVLASIFVNPTQFGPKEDLSRYPRDLPRDTALLERNQVDALFVPEPSEVYPAGFDTYVVPEALATTLCGASRPGHFRGVCTVVLLLMRMSRCHAMVLGEKDYQQLQILRRMSQDLWLDVQVVGAPLIREADGLAQSSRNAYLSASERQDALVLSRVLEHVRQRASAGERSSRVLIQDALALIAKVPSARVDYVSIVDAQNLQPLQDLTAPAVCALAVFIGKTRLIDNCPLL